MVLFPTQKTKRRFLCLTGSHSTFSLSNSRTKEGRGGKIMKEGEEKSAHSTLKALIKCLNVVLTQHYLSASLLIQQFYKKWVVVPSKRHKWLLRTFVKTEGTGVICKTAWQDMEMIGLQNYNQPTEVLMMLLPLPEIWICIHFLPEYFPKTSQMFSNCDFILEKCENIYFVFSSLIFQLKKKGNGFLWFKINALINFVTCLKRFLLFAFF